MICTSEENGHFQHQSFATLRRGLDQDCHLYLGTGKLEAEQVIGLLHAILPCWFGIAA